MEAGGRQKANKSGRRAVRVETEWWRGKLGGRLGEALVRTSRETIAGGVRGDNWSEGRLRCTGRGRAIHTKLVNVPSVPIVRLSGTRRDLSARVGFKRRVSVRKVRQATPTGAANRRLPRTEVQQ